MAPKSKTLPEDFAEQLKTKTVDELIAVFDTTELTAISAANKQCALAYPECPDGLTRWLVAQGLDVDLRSGGGWTPLVLRAKHPEANIRILLELGANPNGVYGGGVPLIHAVFARCLGHVKTLVEHGADPFKPNGVGPNALESAVHDCDRRTQQSAAEANRAVPAQPVSDYIRNQVREHGESLELWRHSRAQGGRDAEDDAEFVRFEAGVRRLYELFAVSPASAIPLVGKHDGVSPIKVAGDVNSQYKQLWDMLVPARGPAPTVQGEVIRIVRRLRREIEGNCGGNWDEDFRAMQ